MSAVSRPSCDNVSEVLVTLPGRSSDTRLEFGIPVIRENTVDKLCLESANHREDGHTVGAGVSTQSDTAEVRDSPTRVDTLCYADHVGQTSNEHTGRSANHGEVANNPYRGELPSHIVAFIRSRNQDKSPCFNGLQYCAPPQINTVIPATPPSVQSKAHGTADLVILPSAQSKAPGTADLVTSPSEQSKARETADLVIPPSAQSKASGTADLIIPPSAQSKADGTADLVVPPSAQSKAPGTADLVTSPSEQSKARGTADLVIPPSVQSKASGTSDLVLPPSAQRKVPGTADLVTPSTERKIPGTAALVAPPSAERKVPETVNMQCDIFCSTEAEVKPREPYPCYLARKSIRNQPTRNHNRHAQRRAERTDFWSRNSDHR